MELSVIIPNYNGRALLSTLIPQLKQSLDSSELSYEIILSDDCSEDDSVEFVKAEYPFVLIAQGNKQLGYAGNCNRGSKSASGEFLCFVNSDILLETEPFSPLVTFLKSAEAFGAMPLIYAEGLGRVENLNFLWKNRGLIWLKPVEQIDLSTPESVVRAIGSEPVADIPLCGAFFICRRKLFEALGGFDVTYSPAYWEDIDLGLRAKTLGYPTYLVPSALVKHLHSRTISSIYNEETKRKFLLRNQALFIRKNLEALKPIPYFRIWLALRLFQRLFEGRFFLIPHYFSLIFSQKV